MPSQMPAPVTESEYSFMDTGAHTGSSPVGRVVVNETLAGPRPLDYTSWSNPLHTTSPLTSTTNITPSGGTTEVLSRAGGMDEAVTMQPISFSAISTNHYTPINLTSTPDTSPANRTPLMPLPAESLAPRTFFFPESQSPTISPDSLLTTMSPSVRLRSGRESILSAAIQQMENQRNTHETKTVTGGSKRIHDPLTYSETSGSLPATSLYPATSILPSILATAHVRPYPANLTPLPSSLRPHCAARERLTK
jgi:hypothetical protein